MPVSQRRLKPMQTKVQAMRSLAVVIVIAQGFLIGCASVPERYSHEAFQKRVSEHPICQNGKATRKLSAAFAIYQKVPKGTAIEDVARLQSTNNKFADDLAENFFSHLAALSVEPDASKVKVNEERPFEMWFGGVFSLGLYPLIVWSSGKSLPQDSIYSPEFKVQHDMPSVFRDQKSHSDTYVVGVSDDTFEYLICREQVCDGLKEPFYSQKIHSRTLGHSQGFYTDRSEHTDLLAGTFGSRVVTSGDDLHRFMTDNYVESPNGGRTPASIDDTIAEHVTISKTIKGEFTILRVTLDPTELCAKARPNSDFYAN